MSAGGAPCSRSNLPEGPGHPEKHTTPVRTRTHTHARAYGCQACQRSARASVSCGRGSERERARSVVGVPPSAAPDRLVRVSWRGSAGCLFHLFPRVRKMGFWQQPGCGRRRLLLTGKWSVSVGGWRWPWRCWCGWGRWFTCWCWAGGGCRSSVPEQGEEEEEQEE